MKIRRFATKTLLALALLLPAMHVQAAQPATAVPKLDLNRLMGTWYQQARLPNKAEKNCASDGLILYSLADKNLHFQIVLSCALKTGTPDARNKDGKASKTGDGQLKINANIWPFTSKYWVLAIGPDYDWAIVGTPNHKTLWLLTRIPVPETALLDQLKARASAQGFDTTKLIAVPQH